MSEVARFRFPRGAHLFFLGHHLGLWFILLVAVVMLVLSARKR